MSTTSFIIDSINSTDKSQLQKNIAINFIKSADETFTNGVQVMDMCQEFEGRFNKVTEVVVSTPEVKIYKVKGFDKNDPENWGNKYPYRLAYYQDNKWQRCSTVSPSLDTAMLVYLSHKYTGSNSQFSEFAIKMLGIKVD